MLKIRDITTDLIRNRLSRVLRHHIGRGLSFESTAEVSKIIDVDARTIDSWKTGERAPQLECFFRLLMLPEGAGPAIAGEMLALIGYAAQPVAHGDACAFRMNAELVGALRELADMLADGRVDHTEDPIWQAKALDLAMKLIGHVNARRAGGAA